MQLKSPARSPDAGLKLSSSFMEGFWGREIVIILLYGMRLERVVVQAHITKNSQNSSNFQRKI
jgi:hypothetical protein